MAEFRKEVKTGQVICGNCFKTLQEDGIVDSVGTGYVQAIGYNVCEVSACKAESITALQLIQETVEILDSGHDLNSTSLIHDLMKQYVNFHKEK